MLEKLPRDKDLIKVCHETLSNVAGGVDGPSFHSSRRYLWLCVAHNAKNICDHLMKYPSVLECVCLQQLRPLTCRWVAIRGGWLVVDHPKTTYTCMQKRCATDKSHLFDCVNVDYGIISLKPRFGELS